MNRTSASNRHPEGELVADEALLVLLRHAMAAIPSAAFITNHDGVVLFSREDLVRASSGDRSVQPGRSRRLSVRRIAPVESPLPAAASRWSLSKRQAEVLALVVEGHANASIAQLLGIALRTVEMHVSALLLRAGVENRSSLVARALGAPTSRA